MKTDTMRANFVNGHPESREQPLEASRASEKASSPLHDWKFQSILMQRAINGILSRKIGVDALKQEDSRKRLDHSDCQQIKRNPRRKHPDWEEIRVAETTPMKIEQYSP